MRIKLDMVVDLENGEVILLDLLFQAVVTVNHGVTVGDVLSP